MSAEVCERAGTEILRVVSPTCRPKKSDRRSDTLISASPPPSLYARAFSFTGSPARNTLSGLSEHNSTSTGAYAAKSVAVGPFSSCTASSQIVASSRSCPGRSSSKPAYVYSPRALRDMVYRFHSVVSCTSSCPAPSSFIFTFTPGVADFIMADMV